MRRTLNVLLVIATAAILSATVVPSARLVAQNVNCYFDQGGSGFHVGNGCTQTVASGGVFNVASGGAFQFAGTSLTATSTQINNLVSSTASAVRVVTGQATTVTASDTVVTGLTTVTACIANLDSAPTTDPEIATCSIGNQTGSPAAGSILVQTWKTLGGTPAAATTFSKKANWVAWGS